MAREWQPASSFSLMPHETDAVAGHSLPLSRSVSRNWSAARGSVLWEGSVDLAGSFPGYANWGSRAQSVYLTLTDRYLLVDEATDYGFGLPIGWLSAAQALTGVEPIATETGDHLRVCYLDGQRVRGFSLRVRGGRFGSRSARRANQLRTAAISLGLASSTPSTDLLLPPEHDLSLDWDDFTSYESEPVVWSGRAAMPVGSGLESAPCDVWLTSASLIWGATSRAGIYRVATESLAAITTAETPGHDPVIYWTVGGSHQTHVDLPMIFARPDRNHPESATRESLVALLRSQGHEIDSPASPPQPWRLGDSDNDTSYIAEPTVPLVSDAGPELASSQPAGSIPSATGRATRSVEASRRRLMDDGLFPERVPATLPRSSPRPWGDRVERVGDEARPLDTPVDGSVPSIQVEPPAERKEPSADRLRIWPPVAPQRQSASSSRDATAMLVRRPRVRATTTEEFLASEQAARAAADPGVTDGTTEPLLQHEHPAFGPVLPDRGVIVRFRRPQTPVLGLAETVQRAAETVVARSTSSFRVPRSEPGSESASILALDSGVGETGPVGFATEPIRQDAGLGDGIGSPTQGLADSQMPCPTITEPEAIDAIQPIHTEELAETGPAVRSRSQLATAHEKPSHLVMMRFAESLIDAQLAIASRSLDGGSSSADRPAIEATAPFLAHALAELDEAVTGGELAPLEAASHRQTLTHSADTAERLRSLLDLHARGYVSLSELETRREALLGRATTSG